MNVDWSNERHVRVYTRDTADWLNLGWEAQAIFLFIMRKVDRAGILEMGRSGTRGLAVLLQMPHEVVVRCLPLLLEDGCVEQHGTNLVLRNFVEAQEAPMSAAFRQKESRTKRRDLVRSGLDPLQRETVIYFVQSEHGGAIKIGRADDMAKRLIGLQTSRPDKLVVLAAAPGTVEAERLIHERFAAFREKGEWFSPIPELLALIADVVTRGSEALNAFAVTNRDRSQNAACHETRAVTPIPSDLSVPSDPSESQNTHKAGAPARSNPGANPPDLPERSGEPKPAQEAFKRPTARAPEPPGVPAPKAPPRAGQAPATEPLSPQAAELLRAMREHPGLDEVPAGVADSLWGQTMGRAVKAEWVAAAVHDVGRKADTARAAGQPWTLAYCLDRLTVYVANAKAPRAPGPGGGPYRRPDDIKQGTPAPLTADEQRLADERNRAALPALADADLERLLADYPPEEAAAMRAAMRRAS